MEYCVIKNALSSECLTYLKIYNKDIESNKTVTIVTDLAILPEKDSLPLLEHGGVSVAVILALSIFVAILLDKIAIILKSLK